MTKPFEKILYAGWGDIDFNNHMTNAAYMAKCVDVRMMYFTENGFGSRVLSEIGIGPVIMKDEIRYFREFALLDQIHVTMALAGMSSDGSRFLLRNELFRVDGTLAARVDSTGGWMDLNTRKLILPPPELLEALGGLHRAEDFKELKSSV
jgi:acyl-CoA thioester hydrolase